jgi:hypothetical protein
MDHKDDRTQTQAHHKSDLTYQVLHAVQFRVGDENGECSLEEIVKKCETYPEEEVFAEIDRLTRRGDLRIMYKQQGHYAVSLPKPG